MYCKLLVFFTAEADFPWHCRSSSFIALPKQFFLVTAGKNLSWHYGVYFSASLLAC